MDEKELFWQEMRQYLKTIFDEALFKNWVDPLKPLRITQDTITLSVPNGLTKRRWEKDFSGHILKHSLEIYGVEYEPIFMIVPDEQVLEDKIKETGHSANQEPVSSINYPNSHLNPSYTFDNFVIGKDNDLASGAAMAVADSPGMTYNPFLIYGGVGLGKTHLMQAIGNEILRKNPAVIIKYATSEEFINDFVSSIRNNTTDDFRRSYREVDILLIDDIQFLSNKGQTQEEFFHTFNALYDKKKQIVLTSDRLPNEINNLEERLISRFKWGLSTDITPPDLETRIAILRKKAENEQLDIDANTLTYIANNVDTNIRELEGALKRVMAYSAIHAQDITPHLAAEALSHVINPQEDQPVTCQAILQKVSHYYQIDIDAIKGSKRKKEIVLPRQVGMYLARELTDLSFPKIGEEFGNKNHTTVIHAYEKITKNIEEDENLAQQVADLKKQLK
ncbi:chromosomal replication initiator protein DnaA [Hutsoniella sourekii]|uniref:chromosomal replication initiator protein DnaA n=1 Tax=Hutsoniella sourekii TaxID=87650 RepID=UPI00047F37A4|nr:chromosomal replication initiator protein DnaA [Hutsoniella sourekii]